MAIQQEKNWFKRHPITSVIFVLFAIVFVSSALGNSNNLYTQPSTSQVAQYNYPAYAPTQTPVPTAYHANTLSNNNYYTNVDGSQVHSPAYSDTVPAGARAQCRDGKYSFSKNRSGTCSHNGGVAQWYY